ncbi:hypothetical protein M2480_000746 [Parabacteroides sp. PFB2-12]|nr:hypothetical protein [Parabacteroides sp. PM6-13]MDH6389781.1 hypothetical protein [Parabacteroides sp. PFB2-12]
MWNCSRGVQKKMGFFFGERRKEKGRKIMSVGVKSRRDFLFVTLGKRAKRTTGGIPLIITNEPGMGSTHFGVACRVGLVYLPTYHGFASLHPRLRIGNPCGIYMKIFPSPPIPPSSLRQLATELPSPFSLLPSNPSSLRQLATERGNLRLL